MERSPNTISEELRRNRVRGRYVPKKAHHKAYVRRKYSKYQGKKIVDYADLKAEIVSRLKDGQKPEMVAGRITKYEKHLRGISKDAIYRWLKTSYGAPMAAWLQKHRPRRNGRGRPKKLDGRRFIEKRPKIADRRGRVGDVEFDFIVSGKSGRGILLVVVDRKARKPFLEKILPVSIANFERAFLRVKKRFPEMKTGTTDNDILLQHHARLARMLGIKIFFCHPYHSWEKGTVENANKVIRRDVPKRSDISKCPKRFIERLEAKLGRRPMKILGYRTPDEMLERHRARSKDAKSRFRGVS